MQLLIKTIIAFFSVSLIAACQIDNDVETTKVLDAHTTAVAMLDGMITPMDFRLEFRFIVNDIDAPDLEYVTISAPDTLETFNGEPIVKKYKMATNGTIRNGQRYYTIYGDFEEAELDVQGARSLPVHGWSVRTEDVNGGIDQKKFSLSVTNGLAIAENARILHPNDVTSTNNEDGSYIPLFKFPSIELVSSTSSELTVKVAINDDSATEMQIFFGSEFKDGRREAVGNVLLPESEGFDVSEGEREIIIPIEDIEFNGGYADISAIEAMILYVLDKGNITTGASAYFSQFGTRSEEYVMEP